MSSGVEEQLSENVSVIVQLKRVYPEIVLFLPFKQHREKSWFIYQPISGISNSSIKLFVLKIKIFKQYVFIRETTQFLAKQKTFLRVLLFNSLKLWNEGAISKCFSKIENAVGIHLLLNAFSSSLGVFSRRICKRLHFCMRMPNYRFKPFLNAPSICKDSKMPFISSMNYRFCLLLNSILHLNYPFSDQYV